MEINETKYSKLFNDSVDVLDKLMRDTSDEPLNDKGVVKVKAASAIISSYPRYRQAQAQVAHVTLSVLEGASENKEQYRELIRAHMPRFYFLKTIPEALTGNRQTIVDLEKKLKDTTAKALEAQNQWQQENSDLRAKIKQLENR